MFDAPNCNFFRDILFLTCAAPSPLANGDVKSGIIDLFIIKYRYNHLI